jgi:hypothetical protein
MKRSLPVRKNERWLLWVKMKRSNMYNMLFVSMYFIIIDDGGGINGTRLWQDV